MKSSTCIFNMPFYCPISIGTAGLAVQVVGSNWPKPHYTLLITGLCRFRVTGLLNERPFPLAEVKCLHFLDLLCVYPTAEYKHLEREKQLLKDILKLI